jgi:hypothetical protein
VLFSWYGSYKTTRQLQLFLYFLFDYNPTGNMEPEVFFVFVMQAKCFGNLLTLFLLGVHLNWQFPTVTA